MQNLKLQSTPIIVFLKNLSPRLFFFLRIVLKKNYEDSTDNFHIFHTRFPLLSYVRMFVTINEPRLIAYSLKSLP